MLNLSGSGISVQHLHRAVKPAAMMADTKRVKFVDIHCTSLANPQVGTCELENIFSYYLFSVIYILHHLMRSVSRHITLHSDRHDMYTTAVNAPKVK